MEKVRLGAAASIFFFVLMLVKSELCVYCMTAHIGNFAFWLILEAAGRGGVAATMVQPTLVGGVFVVPSDGSGTMQVSDEAHTTLWGTGQLHYTGAAVVAQDFNGDGVTDLATANSISYDVSVLFGVSDGTFQPDQRHAVGDRPYSVTTGDFNGDGVTDLAKSGRIAMTRDGKAGPQANSL